MKWLALMFILICCACQSQRKAPGRSNVRDPEVAKKRWETTVRQRAYEMTYRLECVCDSMPVVTVNVDKRGRVVSIRAEPPTEAPDASNVMTIEKIFSLLAKNRRGRLPATALEAKFNTATGAPQVVTIATEGEGTDAEERLVILKLKLE